MPKIYEYFGFVFYFYSNEHAPIHVHVRKAERELIYELEFSNGKLSNIRIRQKKGVKPLDPKEDAEVVAFINKFADGIAKKWMNAFIYNKKVISTKITKRVWK